MSHGHRDGRVARVGLTIARRLADRSATVSLNSRQRQASEQVDSSPGVDRAAAA